MGSVDKLPQSSDSAYLNFSGEIVTFSDGGQWKITTPLSSVKEQDKHAPFEATQVFTCVRMENDDTEGVVEEAVMKIKYQITCEYEVDWLEDSLNFSEMHLQKSPGNVNLQEMAEHDRYQLLVAQSPTTKPNYNTTDEIEALRRFRVAKCPSAPWLLDVKQTTLQEGTHPAHMKGGYLVYILMTKLPGKSLVGAYERFSEAERRQIREAFKEALITVRICGIEPCDRALRNLLWDPQVGKCYLVDYEEWSSYDIAQCDTYFQDHCYAQWGLKEYYRGPFFTARSSLLTPPPSSDPNSKGNMKDLGM